MNGWTRVIMRVIFICPHKMWAFIVGSPESVSLSVHLYVHTAVRPSVQPYVGPSTISDPMTLNKKLKHIDVDHTSRQGDDDRTNGLMEGGDEGEKSGHISSLGYPMTLYTNYGAS